MFFLPSLGIYFTASPSYCIITVYVFKEVKYYYMRYEYIEQDLFLEVNIIY